MAPKKKAKTGKAANGTGAAADPAVDAVQRFLATHNRPYSVQNVVDGLQSQGVKKAAVERALTELASTPQRGSDDDDDDDGNANDENSDANRGDGGGNKVTFKEYGKTRVYLIQQSGIALPTADEMQALDRDIQAKSAELESLESERTALRHEAAQLGNQPTTEAARARVVELKAEVAEAEREHDAMQERTKGYDEQRRQAIVKGYAAALRAWKQRRRAVDDIVKQMADGMEKRPRELYSLMEIETDEEAGAPKLESLPEVPDEAAGAAAGASKKRRV